MNRYNRVLVHPMYKKLICCLDDLEKERIFCRHDIRHFLDVARIMYILNAEEKTGLSKDMIYAAALLHDIGRVKQYKHGIPHNEAGAEIAREILEGCGFGDNECNLICTAILCHRHENECPESGLAALLYRADKMSRLCFNCGACGECYWNSEEKNSEIIF